MDNNNFDRFETNADKFNQDNNAVFLKEKKNSQEGNFFLFGSAPSIKLNSEPVRRINDYDYNLLDENAYKDVKDDAFQLEYRISRIENEIKELNSQLTIANEIHDTELADKITSRLITIKDEYENLLDSYNNKSLSAKFSSKISGIFGNKFKSCLIKLKTFILNIFKRINSKLPEQINSLVEIKQSLNKLENINKSVDELVRLNTPYGEHFDKYRQMSKYIIKANSIQSNIYKHFKK